MAKVNAIPEGSHSVQPYMMFAGCEKAMEFYTKAFGAREVMCMKGPDGRVGGSPISLMLYTEDCDAMYTRAVEAGAESLREPADQPYGIRMSGVRDPFGYKWWIGTQIEAMTVSEMKEAALATHGTV